jgi:cytochrome c-type biogenesis protein CcmH
VTTVFWLLAASMSLLALLFAIVPLLRSGERTAVSRQRLNTEVIKEQLSELRADLDAGRLEPDAYGAARRDLERELLDDVEADGDAGAQTQRSGRWAIGAVAALIPALAVFIYLQLGAAPMLERQAAPPPVAAKPAEEAGHPLEEMVAKLALRLEEDPDNAEGWVLLGRSYAALNRYREAANAYGQAVRLAGGHPELLVDYADILTMATGGRFTPQAGELLQRALATQPDNPKGLWLMGHYKYQQEDFQAAVEYWQRARAQLPPNSEDSRTIRQQIERAESRLVAAGGTLSADAGSLADSPPPAGVGAGGDGDKAIKVTVRLDQALSEKASPQDTVFVFARATNGPRMPLAIVRKQVSDLPVTVTLNDSLAMSPAMVLSNFDQVTVGARVSKSGNAMPQSGDLEGAVSGVQVQPDASVEVVIDGVKP